MQNVIIAMSPYDGAGHLQVYALKICLLSFAFTNTVVTEMFIIGHVMYAVLESFIILMIEAFQ